MALFSTSTESSFKGGGVYGDKIIAQKSSSDVSSDPNEWSHSWEMSKPINKTRITINDNGGTTRPLC